MGEMQNLVTAKDHYANEDLKRTHTAADAAIACNSYMRRSHAKSHTTVAHILQWKEREADFQTSVF